MAGQDRTHHRWLTGLWLWAWLLVCPANVLPQGSPLEQHHSSGAVHLTLRAERQTLGLSDTVRLTLEAEAPLEVQLTWPEASKTLGPFEVLRSQSTGPHGLTPQTQRWQREYVLAPTAAGELSVPALTVQAQSGDTTSTVQTTPLTLTVTSVVPEHADPAAPKDIAPPVELARPGLPVWAWGLGGGLLGLALLAGAWWWYRRRHGTAAPPLVQRPAHTLALAALAQLERDDLIGQGRIGEFYERVSTIVRHYIEWRFDLRAPEQTTEEFLTALLHVTGPIATHREALTAFLQQCDLVKFARHRPLPSDMEETLARACHFVTETADTQVVVTVPPSGVLAP